MRCENEFCMYCKEKSCLLETITINENGMCNECILISIPEEMLEELKKECYLNIIESVLK